MSEWVRANVDPGVVFGIELLNEPNTFDGYAREHTHTKSHTHTHTHTTHTRVTHTHRNSPRNILLRKAANIAKGHRGKRVSFSPCLQFLFSMLLWLRAVKSPFTRAHSHAHTHTLSLSLFLCLSLTRTHRVHR